MRPLCLLTSLLASLLLVNEAHAESSMATLHSIALQQDTIVFEVTSYGCSRDEDFDLRVENNISITLLRNRADRCKRAPRAIQIKRSLKKYGLSILKPFAIRNLFTPPPAKQKPSPEGYPLKKRAIQK